MTTQQLELPTISMLADDKGRQFKILEEHKLECTSDGHSKFWHGTLLHQMSPMTERPYIVKLAWGRIGKDGYKDSREFKHQTLAVQYYNGRVRDKERKNYKAIVGSLAPIKTKKNSSFISDWDIF